MIRVVWIGTDSSRSFQFYRAPRTKGEQLSQHRERALRQVRFFFHFFTARRRVTCPPAVQHRATGETKGGDIESHPRKKASGVFDSLFFQPSRQLRDCGLCYGIQEGSPFPCLRFYR